MLLDHITIIPRCFHCHFKGASNIFLFPRSIPEDVEFTNIQRIHLVALLTWSFHASRTCIHWHVAIFLWGGLCRFLREPIAWPICHFGINLKNLQSHRKHLKREKIFIGTLATWLGMSILLLFSHIAVNTLNILKACYVKKPVLSIFYFFNLHPQWAVKTKKIACLVFTLEDADWLSQLISRPMKGSVSLHQRIKIHESISKTIVGRL